MVAMHLVSIFDLIPQSVRRIKCDLQVAEPVNCLMA